MVNRFIVVTLALLLNHSMFAQTPNPKAESVKTLKAFVQLLERQSIDLESEAKNVLAANNLPALKQKVKDIRDKLNGNGAFDVM